MICYIIISNKQTDYFRDAIYLLVNPVPVLQTSQRNQHTHRWRNKAEKAGCWKNLWRWASLFHRTTFISGWTEGPEDEPPAPVGENMDPMKAATPQTPASVKFEGFSASVRYSICAWAFNLVTNKSGSWQSNFCCKVVEHTQTLFFENVPHQTHWLWRRRQTNLDRRCIYNDLALVNPSSRIILQDFHFWCFPKEGMMHFTFENLYSCCRGRLYWILYC